MEPLVLLACLAGAAALCIWIVHQNRVIAPLRRNAAQLDQLAGVGQAILGAQLKLDALCEIVYQQASRIIDTSNFQLGLCDGPDYVIMIWFRNGERLPSQCFYHAASEGLIGWVIRTGEGLLVGDFEAEWDQLPTKPSYQAQQPVRSALFAPLVAGGETIGVIAVQSEKPHAFDAGDLRLLMVLTNQAAGSIRNAQLFEQTQARNRQLQLVNEVSHHITTIQPLDELFQQIVDLLHYTFGYYAVNFFTADEKQGRLRLRASSHPGYRQHSPEVTWGEGLVGWAAEHVQQVVVPDTQKDSRYLDDAILEESRAEVSVPLVVERRVVGVLDVHSDRTDSISHDDVIVLGTLASQIALAIQEAESYTAERRQRERLNALIEASRAVVSILNIDDLLDEVIDLVTDYFGYDRTHIFLRENGKVVFRAGSGVHSGLWAIEQLAYDLHDPGLIAETARTGRPITVGNVENHPNYVPGPGVEDTRSEMVIPIRMGRQTMGVLDIQSLKPDAFAPEDTALAEALSDTIAIAVRNATLYAREKRRRILAESLREVSTVLGASLEVDNVLNGILQSLERVIPADAAMIVLYDEDEEAYRVSAAHGSIAETTLIGSLIPLEADITSMLTALLDASEAGDAHQHEHIVVPLMLGEETIGYLAIDYHTGHFSPDDLEIINAFATQSAMAIANAQLYMTQREQAWIATALLQVAEATARATNLDEVLQTVARITPLLVGVQWCSVLLAEPEGYRVVEVEGIEQSLAQKLVNLTIQPEEWPPLAQLLDHGEPVILDDHSVVLPVVADLNLRIGQGVMLPLFAKGEIVGALLIGQGDQEEILSSRKIEMVGGIANQAALAIESTQLYAAQQEEAWVTTALLQVAEAVNAQVELISTLETVVRLTPLLAGVLRCGVLRWEADGACYDGTVSYGLSIDAERAFAQLHLLTEQHPYLAALSTSTVPISAGEGTPHGLPPELARLFEAPLLLGLPLTASGKPVGIMLVDHPDGERQIDQRRLNILTGIASQTGLAIETSRLQQGVAEQQRLERELEVAQEIQNSFLPDSAPSIPGWEVAAYYRAARMVGGDFYDFLPLDNGTWGFIVADVADKGVPSALYMALCRTLIRAVARNRDNPASTLLRVNKLLREDTRSDLFVTVWYGILNPADGTVHCSSAGHNPPLVFKKQSAITDTIRMKGIALGVLDDINLKARKFQLEPGDTLVMYTDGITEAQDANGTQFDLSGLEAATRAHCHESASAILDAVIDALDRHTGNEPQFDDLTLIVIRRQDAQEASQS